MFRVNWKGDWLPFPWHVLLLLMLGVGVYLGTMAPPAPYLFGRVSTAIPSAGWWRLVGILLAACPITHWSVSAALYAMRALFALDHPPRTNLWPPAILGMCESFMYPVALVSGHADFIGLWLLLKVAGQWPRWGLTAEWTQPAVLDEGRRRFTLFLIGNALMVMAGATTYGILKACILRVGR
jgi:hypothetical protein